MSSKSLDVRKMSVTLRICSIEQRIQEMPKSDPRKTSLSEEWVALHWKLTELNGGISAAEAFYRSVYEKAN